VTLLSWLKFSAVFLCHFVPLSHQLTTMQNFTDIAPGETLRRGLKARGVANTGTDFELVEGYISETVQDRPTASGTINHYI